MFTTPPTGTTPKPNRPAIRPQFQFNEEVDVREYDVDSIPKTPSTKATRSSTSVPTIPYVLPTALEHSSSLRRRIDKTHRQHEQQQQQQQKKD